MSGGLQVADNRAALLGSPSTGVAIGVGLTGLFIAWREVLSERRQEELDDRRAEERRQRQDQMPRRLSRAS